MTPELIARIAALEARLNGQESLIRVLRHEGEGLKQQLARLHTRHDNLSKDHAHLVDNYYEFKKKAVRRINEFVEVLNEHTQEIKDSAILIGNVTNKVFPDLEDAFQEIDRVLEAAAKKTA